MRNGMTGLTVEILLSSKYPGGSTQHCNAVQASNTSDGIRLERHANALPAL